MEIEARVAFVNSQVVCAQARLAEMTAQNVLDAAAGEVLTYTPFDFSCVPDHYQLGHNTVIEYLRTY